MFTYRPGQAEKQVNEMFTFSQQVKRIMKKAKKLEIKYEKAISKGALLRAARIRRSYMNLAKKYPRIVG